MKFGGKCSLDGDIYIYIFFFLFFWGGIVFFLGLVPCSPGHLLFFRLLFLVV